MYGGDSVEGHEAGAEGAAVAVESRVSIQAEREVGAWEAGHRDAAVQDGYLRERMLLARTQCGVATSEK